ncbi:YihA family ribosome biogenesis GTP-binding protein, partial [Neisseria sp. P0015.S010]
MPDTNYDVAVLFPCKEILMNLFQNAKFFTTVNHLKDLPDTPAEIAFVGRSNAG